MWLLQRRCLSLTRVYLRIPSYTYIQKPVDSCVFSGKINPWTFHSWGFFQKFETINIRNFRPRCCCVDPLDIAPWTWLLKKSPLWSFFVNATGWSLDTVSVLESPAPSKPWWSYYVFGIQKTMWSANTSNKVWWAVSVWGDVSDDTFEKSLHLANLDESIRHQLWNIVWDRASGATRTCNVASFQTASLSHWCSVTGSQRHLFLFGTRATRHLVWTVGRSNSAVDREGLSHGRLDVQAFHLGTSEQFEPEYLLIQQLKKTLWKSVEEIITTCGWNSSWHNYLRSAFFPDLINKLPCTNLPSEVFWEIRSHIQGTLFQFFLSNDTKKLIAMRQFCLNSSGFMPTLPTATPMHKTFFNWNFTWQMKSEKKMFSKLWKAVKRIETKFQNTNTAQKNVNANDPRGWHQRINPSTGMSTHLTSHFCHFGLQVVGVLHQGGKLSSLPSVAVTPWTPENLCRQIHVHNFKSVDIKWSCVKIMYKSAIFFSSSQYWLKAPWICPPTQMTLFRPGPNNRGIWGISTCSQMCDPTVYAPEN